MPSTPPPGSSPASEPVIVHVESDFKELLPKFMTNRKKEVVAMREALAQKNFDSLRKIAHGMKGAGGSYGFDRVTAMAAIIEQAAKVEAAPPIEAELAQLAAYLDQVQVVFE